jgi:hypothetical protein
LPAWGKLQSNWLVFTNWGQASAAKPLAAEKTRDISDGESIGMAAEVAHGSCTDVPPAKK